MPTSSRDRRPVGVLVVVEDLEVQTSPRWVPYKRVAGSLFIPCDSQLQPSLTDDEITKLLNKDYMYVWHPALGLVGAESTDLLKLKDLLAPPAPRPQRWDYAISGIAFRDRLAMVSALTELSFEQLLDQSRDDIGEDSKSLDKLPAGPNEPQNTSIARARRFLISKAAGALYAATNLMPAGSAGNSWIDKLRSTAFSKLAGLIAANEHMRHKEIARLLHMLGQDPDKGLKFALPLSGFGGRGLAPPSNQLAEHSIDFSLGFLGGGRPTDRWNVSAAYQQQLQIKYRELADREMRLGRYRRAAYIFAQLLGDLQSAANVLATGRHFREAAVIYRDRLRRPLEAAKCLEAGGLWNEAIEEYQALSLYEKVGDLYLRLEDREQADAAYTSAARNCHAANDYLSAARIWEDKLSNPEAAIHELKSGWPNSQQALHCIRSLFALLGRLRKHEEAERQIDELVDRCSSTKQYTRTVDILSELAAGDYQSESICRKSGLAVQRLVSERLPSALRAEAYQLVSALSKLAPQDRLLERDGRRFASTLPEVTPQTWTTSYQSTSPRGKVRVAHKFSLGMPGIWRCAQAINDVFVAAGIIDQRILLKRGNFDGEIDSYAMPWPETVIKSAAEIMLLAGNNDGSDLGVYSLDAPPLSERRAFSASDICGVAMSAGALRGTNRPLGVARAQSGFVFAVEGRSGTVMNVINAHGQLTSTHEIPVFDTINWDEVTVPIPMCARRNRLYIGLGRILLIVSSNSMENECVELAHPIVRLAASGDYTRGRLIVGMEVGAYFIWEPGGEHSMVQFATKMSAPYVGINCGGYVIAAADTSVEVYDGKEGRLTLHARYDDLRSSPISVLCGHNSNRFAILCRNGDMLVMEV